MRVTILGSVFGNFLKIYEILFKFCDFCLAELVAKLVVFNSGVALYPVPGNIETGVERVELYPEVLVFYRLFICSAPALGLPALNPAGNSVFNVLAVCIN